jgi:hypothetical protein
LELALSIDGSKYIRKNVPRTKGFAKVLLGEREIEAGAAVIRVGVVNATGARIKSVVVER